MATESSNNESSEYTLEIVWNESNLFYLINYTPDQYEAVLPSLLENSEMLTQFLGNKNVRSNLFAQYQQALDAANFELTRASELALICDFLNNKNYSSEESESLFRLLEKEGFTKDNFIVKYLIETQSTWLSIPIIAAGENWIATSWYTPGGNLVSAKYDKNPELSNAMKTLLNTKNAGFGGTRISEPTVKYNCHSYAWVSRSTSNKYWLDNVAAYISDPAAVSIISDVRLARPGDIIFWDTNNTKYEHSAVIEQVSGSEVKDIYVTSKWGEAGLYQHNVLNCPYYSNTFAIFRLK